MGALGRRGHDVTKSRQAGDICGVAGLYLWSTCMAGEISPDIMFYVFCRKWSKMNVYGNGREKKQDKKSPKRESMTCFVVCTRGKKRQKVGRSGHGDQRRSFEGIWGEKVVCGTQWKGIGKGKEKNNRQSQKQTKTNECKLVYTTNFQANLCKH